jgi:hypothetical protein
MQAACNVSECIMVAAVILYRVMFVDNRFELMQQNSCTSNMYPTAALVRVAVFG